jgi:glycerol-3-phosphate acyltransferase PlsY
MGAAFPLIAWWRMGSEPYGREVPLGLLAFTLLVLLRHRTNITRMIRGTEPKVGRKRPAKESP